MTIAIMYFRWTGPIYMSPLEFEDYVYTSLSAYTTE